MNVKQKLEKIKTKFRENRPQIIAAVSTGVAVIMTVMLVDANRKLEEAADALETSNDALRDAITHIKTPIRLAVGDCALDGLKDGDVIFWESNGHTIDLAYDPEAVCEEHTGHAKPMDISEV